MAERGVPENTISSEKIATTVNARSLECPICLDKLRHPKSLPCLHSFCEECLAVYITKETGDTSIHAFPCPICRTVTSPVDPTATADVWAKQFPTNSLIMELSDTQKEEHFCQPCKNKGNSKSPAECWCDGMNSFFCLDCKTNLHDTIHIECSIIHVSSMTSQTKDSATKYPRCKKHNKKTDLFCEDHSSLACSKCIAIDHRRCDLVLTAADYCEKLNDGTKFGEVKTSVSEGIHKLQTWIKDTKQHLENFSTDREQILSDLTDLRQKINTKFDELQEALIKDLTEVYKEQKTNMDKHIQRCERMTTADATSLLADPKHTISVLLRGTAEVESCESLFKDIETSHKPIRIRYESTGVKDIKFDLGKIVVEQVLLDQNQQTKKKSFSERSAQKFAEVSVRFPSDKSKCYVTGILLISDGRIVLADKTNKKIKLVTDKGYLLDELSLPDQPFDLCQVDTTTVAVTRPNIRTISLVDITPSKLSLMDDASITTGKLLRDDASITTGKSCYGITYHDGTYTITTGYEEPYEVFSVTQSGRVETSYTSERSHQQWYLVYDPRARDIVVTNETFSSSPGGVAVSRLSKGNSVKAIAHRGIIKGPRGVVLDCDGNMYICGFGSNNVVRMSSDGSMVRELLTSSDGMNSPQAISVRADKFVLSFPNTDHITIYQLF